MRIEIERFINVTAAQRYLEIGLGNGKNFDSVPLEKKVCVSPIGSVKPPGKIFNCTSDEYFQRNTQGNFDVIFIDGYHSYNQVVRDLENSVKALNRNGVILIHDINPLDKPHHVSGPTPHGGQPWCGDVWKIVFYVKHLCPYLDFASIGGFPGWLVVWKTDRIRPVQPFPAIGNIESWPIEFGKKNRQAFEFGTIDDAVQKFKRCNHSVAGLMAINNFPMAPELLGDFSRWCDLISLRLETNGNDTKIQNLCIRKLVMAGKRFRKFTGKQRWNRWNWREELIRSIDTYEPNFVLFLDEDESFQGSKFEQDFDSFRNSDIDMMMFDYKMITSDNRNPKKYPGCRHCKAFRWKPHITYRSYGGYAKPTNMESIYLASSKIEHYCFFTKQMEKTKILHK